jgi:hypothetical protein
MSLALAVDTVSLSVQTGAIALVSVVDVVLVLRSGRKASSYLLASERTKHLR